MSSTSGAARKETSRCAHARGSTPRSPTTSSRSIACRPSSATHCDCKSPLPGTPAQPRLILGQNEESAHILLRKKPAARHLFQPLVFSFVSIINVQTNRLPQKSKPVPKKLFHSVKNLTMSLYQKKIRNASTVFSYAWTFQRLFAAPKQLPESL